MTRFKPGLRSGLAALALAACAPSAPAGAPPPLPPLDGEVSGALQLAALPSLGLEWRVSLAAGTITLAGRRAGVDVVVELSPDRELGQTWRWTVRRGEIDVAEVWPDLRPRLGKAAEGWSASGRFELGGEGAWSADSGAKGELRATLREGWARSDALDVEVGGIELDLVARDLTQLTLAPTQTLRVGKISAAGAEIGALRLVFGLEAGQMFKLAEGEANVLGGRVRLQPFGLPLSKPAFAVAADVEAVRLGEAARLLPWLVQSAQGNLRGRVELAWDATKGLRVRDGGLKIVQSDGAAFRLAPSPGLLTGKMPRRLAFLPWKWARWISVNNPAYAPLHDIELGREGLQVDSLEIEFRPDGAGTGRTAAIRIVGRPSSGDWVRQVKLDINFHGPWSEFLGFGINNDLSQASFRFE